VNTDHIKNGKVIAQEDLWDIWDSISSRDRWTVFQCFWIHSM